MKSRLVLAVAVLTILASGCALGIKRTGYQLPAGKASKDLPTRPLAIWCNASYDTNDVDVLGAIQAYDTGFSTACDEAAVLDTFCREGNLLGADVINITEEKQPNPWTSTCYRAKALFMRFKDREKAKNLVSDAKYAPQLIVERSAAAGKRNKEIIAGTVFGGILGAVVVTAATEPHHAGSTNAVVSRYSSPKQGKP